MKSTIERAMERISFDVQVDPDKFLTLSEADRKLLVSSLSEKEKFANLKMFKTLPDGKVKWNL